MPKRLSKTSQQSPRGKTAAPSLAYEPWLIQRLKEPDEATAYLEAVLEDGDKDAITLALQQIASAKGR